MIVFIEVPTRAASADIEVEVEITPGTPGRMYLANGDPGYPPEPAEVEVLNAWVCRGWDEKSRAYRHRRKIVLPDRCWRQLEEAALEQAWEEDQEARDRIADGRLDDA